MGYYHEGSFDRRGSIGSTIGSRSTIGSQSMQGSNPSSYQSEMYNRPPGRDRQVDQLPHPQHGSNSQPVTWDDLEETIQATIRNSIQDVSASVYNTQAWIPVAVEVVETDPDQMSAVCSHASSATVSESNDSYRRKHN